MNKNTKGTIAVGAAVLLLLGGGGTFALWNETETLGNQTVQSGELSLSDVTGAWYEDAAGTTPVDVDDYAFVPESKLYYIVDADVNVKGNDLAFVITNTSPSTGGNGFTVTDTDVTITGLTTGASGDQYSDGTTDYDGGGVFVYDNATAPATTPTVEAAIEVTFDADDLDNQNVTSALNNLSLTIQQVIKN